MEYLSYSGFVVVPIVNFPFIHMTGYQIYQSQKHVDDKSEEIMSLRLLYL